MKGRVSKIIITKHPHPNPPPSMGRGLFGNPDAEHRGNLSLNAFNLSENSTPYPGRVAYSNT